MPRSNRRRRDHVPVNVTRIQGGPTSEETYAGTRWTVRAVTGASASRPYLCPGCQQDIQPGVPHVVVWPAEGVGGLGDRRHWHSGCWRKRDARPSGSAYL